MDFLQPTSWADALAARAERPDALPIAGGTDVMVDLNFDRRRPGALLDLCRVPELLEWTAEDGWIRLGAGVPYARIIEDLGAQLPGLAMASRTVGSPQIRIRGTVGGNLGSASPAGDAHPPLLATEAVVEVESAARGTRTEAISSSGSSALRFTPVKNASAGISRVPRAADSTSITAPAASSGGWASPAGDAEPRLPPTVPRIRICGEPTVRDAMARPGSSVPSSSITRA